MPLKRGALKRTLEEIIDVHSEHSCDVLLSAFLTGLMVRGPSEDELVELIETALSFDRIPAVRHDRGGRPPLLVVAGSGKKGMKTINVSTPSCLVAASAGARVIKVGSGATSSALGSRDLIQALGIPEAEEPEDALVLTNQHGFAFLSVEKQIPHIDRIYGGRFYAPNPFSFALPALACPIRGDLLIYGLSHPRVDLSAAVLARFGVRDAVVVTSKTPEGFFVDEVGIGVESSRCVINGGNIGSIEPMSEVAQVRRHLERAPLRPPSTAAEAHIWVEEVLSGRGRQSHIQIVALNAAFLMVLSGLASSLEQAHQDARDALSSGLVLKKINDMRVENEIDAKQELVS